MRLSVASWQFHMGFGKALFRKIERWSVELSPMQLIVFPCTRRKFWLSCLGALSSFAIIFSAQARSLPQLPEDVPYLGLYINLDNRLYAAGTDVDALSFQSINGVWAFVVYPAVMSNCSSLGGSSLGDSLNVLVYGLTDPALPITSANYQLFSDANGSVAVLSATSVPGDVSCDGELSLIPVQYDHLFGDGFDATF